MLRASRVSGVFYAFAFILATLMYLILDFDMMMRGFIQVDHSSLVKLIDEMAASLKQ